MKQRKEIDFLDILQSELNNGIKTDINELKEKISIIPQIELHIKLIAENVNTLSTSVNQMFEKLSKENEQRDSDNAKRDIELTKISTILKLYNWFGGAVILTLIGLILEKFFS